MQTMIKYNELQKEKQREIQKLEEIDQLRINQENDLLSKKKDSYYKQVICPPPSRGIIALRMLRAGHWLLLVPCGYSLLGITVDFFRNRCYSYALYLLIRRLPRQHGH